MYITTVITYIINYIKQKKDSKRLTISIIVGIISCYIFLKLFNYFFKIPFILLIGTLFGFYIYRYGTIQKMAGRTITTP